MPCPTCNQTMQNLGLDTSPKRTFWCPNCGTLKTVCGDFEESERPALVRRLQDPDMHLHEIRKEICVQGIAAFDESGYRNHR